MNQEEAKKILTEGKLMQLGNITMVFCQPNMNSPYEIRVIAKKTNSLRASSFMEKSQEIKTFIDGWKIVAEALETLGNGENNAE